VIEELARLQKTMAEFESEPARLRPIAELERVQMMADRYNQFAMSKPGRLAERFIDSGAMRSYRRLVARLSQVDPPNKAG
jgi:hypothetical protein